MAINSPTTSAPARLVAAPVVTAPAVPNTPQGIVMNSGSDQPSSGGSKKTVIIISIVLIVLIVSAVLLLGVVKKPFAGLATGIGGEEFEVAAGEVALAELRDSAGTSVVALRNGQEYEADVFAGVDALDSFIFAVTMPAGVTVGPLGSAFSASGFETRETFIDGKYYVYSIASPAVVLDGGRLGTLHLISQSDVDAGEIQIEFSALDDAEEELIRTTSNLEIGEADAPDIGCDRPCDFEGGRCLGNLMIQFCRDGCIVPDEVPPCGGGYMCNPVTASCEPDGDNDGKLDAVDNCIDVRNLNQADVNGFEDGVGEGDACENVPPLDGDIDQDGLVDDVDNCIDDPNVDQLDTDLDGIGDVCDVEEDVIMKADLDADHRVTLDDAILLARSVLGIIDEEFTLAQADVTGEGIVNLDDAIRIARYTLGIVDQLEGN